MLNLFSVVILVLNMFFSALSPHSSNSCWLILSFLEIFFIKIIVWSIWRGRNFPFDQKGQNKWPTNPIIFTNFYINRLNLLTKPMSQFSLPFLPPHSSISNIYLMKKRFCLKISRKSEQNVDPCRKAPTTRKDTDCFFGQTIVQNLCKCVSVCVYFIARRKMQF